MIGPSSDEEQDAAPGLGHMLQGHAAFHPPGAMHAKARISDRTSSAFSIGKKCEPPVIIRAVINGLSAFIRSTPSPRTVNGVADPTYSYNLNGNVTAGAGRTITYTGFNMGEGRSASVSARTKRTSVSMRRTPASSGEGQPRAIVADPLPMGRQSFNEDKGLILMVGGAGIEPAAPTMSR